MNQSTARAGNPVAYAETRSAIYQLLALGWRYPSRGAFKAFRSGHYFEDLLRLTAALPHLTALMVREDETAEQARDELAEMSLWPFEARYVATFDDGFAQPPCEPCESLYNREMGPAAVRAEVSEFYRHFGLNLSQQEDEQELPDHLCVELDFLAFLTFKEAQMAHEGAWEFVDGYRWAQRDFLDRHMLGWLPAFAARLAEEALPFYPHLARFTIEFIGAELDLLNSLAEMGDDRWSEGAQPALNLEPALATV